MIPGPSASSRSSQWPNDEPGAANVLRIGDTVLMPSSFPLTEEILRARGFNIKTIDISELIKAEAAVTCSSVIFETAENV